MGKGSAGWGPRCSQGYAPILWIKRAASREDLTLSILTGGHELDATWTRCHADLESIPGPCAMLGSMRRRNPPEPFKPRRDPTWLVVRDALSRVIESSPLEPYANLREVLTAARPARVTDGWECERIGDLCALFFCTRDGVRHMVAIEMKEPPLVGELW